MGSSLMCSKRKTNSKSQRGSHDYDYPSLILIYPHPDSQKHKHRQCYGCNCVFRYCLSYFKAVGLSPRKSREYWQRKKKEKEEKEIHEEIASEDFLKEV